MNGGAPPLARFGLEIAPRLWEGSPRPTLQDE